MDFFVNLMKRMQRRATVENWQDLLATLYWRQSEVDSWMLRNSGFNKLPLESRLAMLKVSHSLSSMIVIASNTVRVCRAILAPGYTTPVEILESPFLQ